MELRERMIGAATALFQAKGLWFTLQEVADALHISKKPFTRFTHPKRRFCWTW